MSRRSAHRLLRRFARCESGMAMVEMAFALPIGTVLLLTGAELTNFITVKMRVSQVALHLADHASRIGSGSLLAAKTISETQINDVLTGAGLQAGELNLYQNGRVIISDLEPDTANAGKFKIVWQRCRGALNYTSSYGNAGANNLSGIGPAGQQVTSPDDSATAFVEVRYTYQPIVAARWAPFPTITEIASMTIRDRRDRSQIYNSEGATAASCSTYSAT